MPMLEGQVDAVIGVDPDRDTHAAALLDPNGGVRATREVPSDRAGHAQLLQLADEQTPRSAGVGPGGDRLLWGRADPVPDRPG
jgi:hypothetical protein